MKKATKSVDDFLAYIEKMQDAAKRYKRLVILKARRFG